MLYSKNLTNLNQNKMFLDLRDAEDFMNRVDRTLKKDSMKLNKEERREEVGGITTAIFLSIVIICLIIATIQAIFNIL